MSSQQDMSSRNKWLISLLYTALFVVLSSPMMFKLTNKITFPLGLTTSVGGCPTMGGVVLHGLVFLLLSQLLMFIPTGQLLLATVIGVSVAVILNIVKV